VDRDEPESGYRLRLSLELERLHGIGLDSFADECERVLSEQDLARGGGLLETGSDVDGVAGRQALLRSSDDLAGVQADAGLDAELGQCLPHLHGRAAGPERVVLVHLGDPEHGHDRIADELLHCSPVRFDDPFHALEVAGEQGA
jgi:hypothetical protein